MKHVENLFVSVDCVLIGFDGKQLYVLLVKQKEIDEQMEFNNYKLPGSLLAENEELDDAAQAVLLDLTGLKKVKMRQFKSFGSTQRLKNPKDVVWLSHIYKTETPVKRIVTISYLSLLRLERKLTLLHDTYEACWIPLNEVGTLAFDHNEQVKEALATVRQLVRFNPSELFALLPRKFTIAQLRTLYGALLGKEIDVRNFHKRIIATPYVVPLDEFEKGVAHRAARFYKFDKQKYSHYDWK